MDFTEAIKHLDEAEQALRQQIARSTSEDYDSMFRCLEIAQKVKDISNELSRPQESVNEIIKNTGISATQSLNNTEFPVYFVHENKLWKVAMRSDESGKQYKKSLPFSDAKTICSTIHSLLNNSDIFTMAETEKALKDMPTYKIQITVMALVKAGCFTAAGRGKYTISQGASRSERRWIEVLSAQKVMSELLN
jgi:chemotaxis regulatin CheY-phosphate phosphatase CheZ